MRVRGGKKIWLVALMVFVAVFLFTFLTAKFKNNIDVEAANLANFDPGYIISDYQMGNYNSMSEAEIWNFLKQKGNCNDTRIWQTGNNLGYLSESAPYSWHVSDGHYVCLADENFSGESAAHIIWQAAQDYRINPQVLIVLLQKEQGLITDSFPNSVQYRSATGYGCPDTAACSSRYYGFKNQVRNAAALFRTVLDGGWTNYPLGNNYIQYNPNSGCGGSWVNIRSLATSALYRYTPYQPNASALAAGYGAGDSCGAYGNRNFYSYFEDWFGGITAYSIKYIPLVSPRYMEVASDATRINPKTRESVDIIEKGRLLKFTSKVVFSDGTSCLRTEYGTQYDEDKCLMTSSLKEINLSYKIIPEGKRRKIINANSRKYYIRGASEYLSFNNEIVREMIATTEFMGKTYYITSYDYYNNNSEYGFLIDDVSDAPEYTMMSETKEMTPVRNSVRLNPVTGEQYDRLEKNKIYTFASYIIVDGVKYYRTLHNTENNIDAVVSEKELQEVSFVKLEKPRRFRLIRDARRINPITGETYNILESGREIVFTTKIYINQKWYYRTENNSDNNYCLGIEFDDLEAIKSF